MLRLNPGKFQLRKKISTWLLGCSSPLPKRFIERHIIFNRRSSVSCRHVLWVGQEANPPRIYSGSQPFRSFQGCESQGDGGRGGNEFSRTWAFPLLKGRRDLGGQWSWESSSGAWCCRGENPRRMEFVLCGFLSYVVFLFYPPRGIL